MKNLTFLLALLFATSAYAQKTNYFVLGTDNISKKKPAYITLISGETVEGTIKDLDWKKGLVEEVKIKNEDGKRKIKPEEIKHMYLPQSNWNKVIKFYELTESPIKMQRSDINQEHIKKGYAYFESVEVQDQEEKDRAAVIAAC